MSHPESCIFCQIARRQAPCHLVHEDEHTLTFLDIFPVARGHTLIIPKLHFDDIFSAAPDALAAVARQSVAVAKALDELLQVEGLGVYQLNRPAAGQTVFHYHMHLVPRSQGQTLSLHSRVPGDSAELATLAGQLRERLQH